MNRSRRRILLTTLGSLGDLHPVMALALGLRDRGHEVAVATSEFYREKIEGAGLAFHPVRPAFSPDDAEIVREALDPARGPEFLVRSLLLPHLEDMYADVMAASEGADFMVAGEIVFAAPLVAERRGIPWAAAILAPFSFFSSHDPSVLPMVPFARALTHAPAAIQKLLMGGAALLTHSWGTPIAELRSRLGLRATQHPLLRDRFSPFLNLAMFGAVLGKTQSDWPANTTQTGFAFYDRAQAGGADSMVLDEFLAKGAAPIVFTLGSAAVLDAGSFFDDSAEIARRLDRRAILLMGKNPPPARQSSDLFACDYAPYSQVFPGAACVVHQGGVGTTAQALRAGAPQLVMPYAFDQPDNASRVRRMGAGLSVSRKRFQIDRMVGRLRELLETPRYRERAADIGREVRADDGVTRACDAIERLLVDSP